MAKLFVKIFKKGGKIITTVATQDEASLPIEVLRENYETAIRAFEGPEMPDWKKITALYQADAALLEYNVREYTRKGGIGRGLMFNQVLLAQSESRMKAAERFQEGKATLADSIRLADSLGSYLFFYKMHGVDEEDKVDVSGLVQLVEKLQEGSFIFKNEE